MSVQAAVPDVVWWPANIMEMNMPVTVEALDVGVGIDVGDRIRSLFEVAVEPGEAAVELAAEARADEAGRGGVHLQHGEPLQEIDLTLVAPAGHHLLYLVRNGGGLTSHELFAQRLFGQH